MARYILSDGEVAINPRIIGNGSAAKKAKCWMRKIRVTLTSEKCLEPIIFDNFSDTRKQFTMDIVGTKRVATNEDKGTFTIYNLEYDTLMKIVLCEYYGIRIEIGYQSSDDLITVHKGEISYVSQKIHSKHDVETYITFASTFVAKYSQSRMNFNLNSGVNIYAALNYICKLNNVSERVNIDPNLKKVFLNNMYTNYTNMATVFDNLTSTSGNFQLSTDESEGNVVNVTDIKNCRKIKVDPNTINITKGNPTVTSAGLKMSLLPNMNYMPGDILCIDNAMINTSISDADSVPSTFNTNYLDQNGMYMIMEINYHFQNRGSAFEYNIRGRALDIINKLQIS